MAVSYKQHDTAPAYVADLRDNINTPSEAALDLTDADEVHLLMRSTALRAGDGPAKVRGLMTIVGDPADGRVQYDWQTGDLDTVGSYDLEFEITWLDGTVETVPNDSYLSLTVLVDLDEG